MAAKKRQLEDTASVPKAKKTKVASEGKKEKKKAKPEHIPQPTAHIAPEETDFPRGGGTSFTPLEVKTIRAEAVKEANDELFKVRDVLTALTCDFIPNPPCRRRNRQGKSRSSDGNQT